MEAIAAFALAGNVLQVINIGCTVATTLNQVYRDGTTEEHTTLAENAQSLKYATSKLQSSTTRPATRDDDELCAIAQKCTNVAVELEQKVASTSLTRRRDRLKKGFQTIWIKGDIDKLEAKLKSYRDVLSTQILVNLRKRFDILAIEQQEGFNSLESTIQEFCRQQADIRKQELDLIVREIRDGNHKTATSIQALQLTTAHEKQYDRLLSSLIFPSMNARKNQITLAHTNTCEWIFGTSPDSMNGDNGHGDGYDKMNNDDEDSHDDDNDDGDYNDNNDNDYENNDIWIARSSKPSEPLWNDFGDWLRTGNNIYWISGKAGSGKSTLMKLLCDHSSTSDFLNQWATPQDVLCLEAYLWDAGSEAQKSLQGLIATLLAQILQQLPYLGEILLKDQPTLQQKSQFDDWSARELQDCLFFTFRAVDQRFCLFIDGLDEGRATHSQPREATIDFIVALSAFESVKSCVSSRPLRVYESAFSGYPKLRLEDLNSDDIEKVYRDRLSPSIREAYTVTGAESYHLRNQFKEKANGVFLWAYLAIESLKQGIQNLDSFEVLKNRLEILPSELNDLYEDMWKRQNDADRALYREEASRFLRLCLIHDPPSINRSVLQYTLSLPQSENLRAAAMAGQIHHELLRACESTQVHIRTRCAGMLEIVPDSSHDFSKHFSLVKESEKLENMRFTNVQFIHRTAKDFLLTTPFGQEILTSQYTDVDLAHLLFRARLCEMSMSSQPLTIDLLECFLDEARHMPESDHLTLLQATEAVCVDTFSRVDQGSENVKDWFSYAKCDDVLQCDSEGQAYGRNYFDFLAFTVSCHFSALAEHFLCASSRKVNKAYSRYILLSWDWEFFHHENGGNITKIERWERYLGLFTNLLQLSYLYQTDTMDQIFDDDSRSHVLFLEWTPNYALRQSVQSHLCSELLKWNGFEDFRPSASTSRKAAHFLCQYLALQTNLNDKMLYWLRLEAGPPHLRAKYKLAEKRRIEVRKFENYYWSYLPSTGLVIECNVHFQMSRWFEQYVDLEDDAFFEIRTSLSSANVEPSIRCLLAHCEDKSPETSFSIIQEEDSNHLIALLDNALPPLWIRGGIATTFEVNASLWESISANMTEVHRRGEPADLFKYLKKTGWVKDMDDPEVMRHPPPMYLDDDENQLLNTATGKDDGEAAKNEYETPLELPIGSSHEDQTDDEFFDAAEEHEKC